MDYRDLPYDAEIEYLGSDGSSYINTGIYPNYSDNVELIFKLSDVVSSTRDNLSFFGAFNTWAKGAFSHAWNNANTVYMSIGTYENKVYSNTNESNYTDDWHSFALNGRNCILDGNTKTVSRGTGATNIPMYIFATNHNNTVLYGIGTKRYFKNFRLLDSNNIPKLDLIPVRVGNVGYLFDKVSKQLFGNSGTGDFVLGPDVAPGRYANEIAFLESTGSQYIDLGVKANQDSVFELEFMATPRPEGQGVRVFGAREAWNQNAFAMTSKDATDMMPSFTYDNVTASADTLFPTINLDDGHWHTVKSNGQGHLQVDDVSKTVTFSNFTTPYNILLFGFNNGGTILGGCIKIRRVVLNNMQLIPVEYNNIGYLYDKVSGQFFANQGTGKFVLGHRAPRFDGKACARSYTRRQLMAENYVGKAPNGYKWLEYIENTSSAYIDTGLKGKANLKIDATWLFKQSEIVGLMGASYVHTPCYALLYRANWTSGSYFYYGNSYSGESGLTLNKKWHIVMDKGKLYYNDVLKRTLAATGDSTYNFMLFRVADHNSYVKGQLFGCKIYDDDILVRDYRPIKRLSDNKYGLWDKVNQTFNVSPNGVNFVGG